jgi:hypothetical protein
MVGSFLSPSSTPFLLSFRSKFRVYKFSSWASVEGYIIATDEKNVNW